VRDGAKHVVDGQQGPAPSEAEERLDPGQVAAGRGPIRTGARLQVKIPAPRPMTAAPATARAITGASPIVSSPAATSARASAEASPGRDGAQRDISSVPA
jgi:hypothetical protein